jgi:aminoglycoside 2''-phosphotransferase
VVNEDLVFRFAKDENGQRMLQAETQILDRIRPHLTLAVPEPFYSSHDAMAYRLLPGQTLSRQVLTKLNETTQQRVADQLAEFLRELHGVPLDATLPQTPAPVRRRDWLRIRNEVERVVYPLLMAHQVTWARQLFDTMLQDHANFDHEPRLIHGDLAPYHILFDQQTGRIHGVIDFGVAGAGDPALDLSSLLYHYGESFTSKLLVQYPEASHFWKRARFYAQAIELQWALSGITTGQTFWFLAHLGSARDIP